LLKSRKTLNLLSFNLCNKNKACNFCTRIDTSLPRPWRFRPTT
jgi:hypothetical protein